ncbi:uncharacterized protein LOC135485731 [Lineus longissimus]|uniref:uncharacterized protein LOC135485731 n=1 Tax=Lineus longissimus TaxID=88925 RepID=UPI002B4DB33C
MNQESSWTTSTALLFFLFNTATCNVLVWQYIPEFWPDDITPDRWTGYNYARSSDVQDFVTARAHCRSYSRPGIKVDILGDASEPLVKHVLNEVSGAADDDRVWKLQEGGHDSSTGNSTMCPVYDFRVGNESFASCQDQLNYVCFVKKGLDMKTNPNSYWYLLLPEPSSAAVSSNASVRRLLVLSAVVLTVSFRWIEF